MRNPTLLYQIMRHFALPHLAFLICSIWLCRKLLCFTYLLATGSAAYHFRQRRSRHRSRNKRPPAAEDQALRGTRLKALLALDFCLFMRGRSCKPDSQYATTDICSDTPAVRYRRNEGACTRHHAHKYLWQCIHCQVCTNDHA